MIKNGYCEKFHEKSEYRELKQKHQAQVAVHQGIELSKQRPPTVFEVGMQMAENAARTLESAQAEWPTKAGSKGKGRTRGKGKDSGATEEIAHVDAASGLNPAAKTFAPSATQVRKEKPNLISGGGYDTFTAIDDDQNSESILNVAEKIGHFGTRTDRVCNTVELSDFFVTPPTKEDRPCYSVSPSLQIAVRSSDQKIEAGLGPLLDELSLINPEFLDIKDLSDLGDSNFETMEYQRPPGYSATTRLHMGRLCVPILNDTGATCACITEEQMVLLVNHVQKMISENKISKTDYNYPLVKFFLNIVMPRH